MTGLVVRVIAQKKFGFIRAENSRDDYFFHAEDFNGFFDDLLSDFEVGRKIKVTFESVPSVKGLRAADVSRVDGGIIS